MQLLPSYKGITTKIIHHRSESFSLVIPVCALLIAPRDNAIAGLDWDNYFK